MKHKIKNRPLNMVLDCYFYWHWNQYQAADPVSPLSEQNHSPSDWPCGVQEHQLRSASSKLIKVLSLTVSLKPIILFPFEFHCINWIFIHNYSVNAFQITTKCCLKFVSSLLFWFTSVFLYPHKHSSFSSMFRQLKCLILGIIFGKSLPFPLITIVTFLDVAQN